MNKEVKPTWNYILNDLALYSLFMRVAYSEDVPKQDKIDLEHQIKLLQQENKELQQKVNQLETNRDEAIKELFVLKDMIYKPETREENFEIQRKISSILIGLERGKE